MAMTPSETKNLFKVNYDMLVLFLELEKRDRPETYEIVANFAEKVRRGFIDSTGAADDFPALPKK